VVPSYIFRPPRSLRAGSFTLIQDPHGSANEVMKLVFDNFRAKALLAFFSSQSMALYSSCRCSSVMAVSSDSSFLEPQSQAGRSPHARRNQGDTETGSKTKLRGYPVLALTCKEPISALLDIVPGPASVAFVDLAKNGLSCKPHPCPGVTISFAIRNIRKCSPRPHQRKTPGHG
jgi:hypothetical protein